MERRNYIVLMIVGIVAIVLTPVVPCRAGWIHGGTGASSGSPDSDSDSGYGTGSGNWYAIWYWSYNVSGGSRGADSSGCYATASMSYSASAFTQSWGGSASASVPDVRWVAIYADSYYSNIPNMGYRYLDYTLDAYVSGEVSVEGNCMPFDPNAGSAYGESEAYGDTDIGENTVGGDDYGYGYVEGSFSSGSTGDTWWTVGGEAEEDSDPTVTESTGYYSITLDFTIDVYEGETIDCVGGPSSYTASAGIQAGSVDAYASVSINENHYGESYSDAYASMDGYSIVDVDLYN